MLMSVYGTVPYGLTVISIVFGGKWSNPSSEISQKKPSVARFFSPWGQNIYHEKCSLNCADQTWFICRTKKGKKNFQGWIHFYYSESLCFASNTLPDEMIQRVIMQTETLSLHWNVWKLIIQLRRTFKHKMVLLRFKVSLVTWHHFF